MKKLILLLLSSISVVSYSQTYPTTHAENTKFTGTVRFDQPVRQNGTDTLATKKYARGLISIPDTVTKIATKYDLIGKENTLPTTPLNPESKYLNGNRQWSEITVGSGGYAANVYPTTIASDISGYYKLSYTNESTQTIRSYTVTNQELQVNTSIYDDGIGVTTIDAGIWMAHMRMYVSSASGNTVSRAEVFLRHTDGTETTLFSASSIDINNTSADWVISESNQPSFSCLATDRLGIRHYISTDSHSAVTVYVVVGNGYASYINTPLALRHNQLRGLNDDSNYQHVTTTQISTWNAKQNALGFTPENSANKGAANGYAPLDASSKISTTYLPAAILGALKYQGTWAASVGVYPSSPGQGNYWVISTAGTLGATNYKVGDWLTYNGTSWDKIDNQQTVSSVNGQVGAVEVGTVKSVGLVTSSEGLITNGPVTSIGSLAVNVVEGFKIPTTTQLANAATAYSWGNHSLAGYALATGTNASGTWPISISGTATNTSKWDNLNSGLSDAAQSTGVTYLIGQHTNNYVYRFNSTAIQSWLGLGSNAYTNTAYLPLTAGPSYPLSNTIFIQNNDGRGIISKDNSGNGLWILSSLYDQLGGSNSKSGASLYVYGNNSFDISTNATRRLTVDGSGNVGIGTTSPSYTLDVSGTIRATSTVTATNFILSDIRLKENIYKINSWMLPINYYTYNFKADKAKAKRYGVIAQELEKVAPELVNTDKDGMKSVNYIDLLVREVNALKEEVKDLRHEINKLKYK